MNIETIIVGEFQVNCFLLWNQHKKALVIDPGDEAERIADALDQHGLEVEAYLLTHAHMDHISALADLYDQRPAPIALHEGDANWAFTPVNSMPPFYGVPREPAEGIGRQLEDGQTWTDAGMSYRVISTPGHTPGCVCFYFEDSRTLISGDTLFAGSVGRTDFPYSDARAMQNSLLKLAALPDNTTVYAGHGPATEIGTEKRTNYLMRHLL